MRIVQLTTENFRRLRAVRWRPGPHSNQIVGKNEQGKTSLLDSVWSGLGGARASGEQPIRAGERSARVELRLGDITVRRVWSERGTSLVVEDSNGSTMRSPQAILDGLTTALGTDAHAFARANEKEQLRAVLDVAGIRVDDLDAQIKELTEERRLKTRDAKQAKAAAEQIPPAEEGVDYDVIQEQLDAWKSELDAARRLVQALESDIEGHMKFLARAGDAKRRTELLDDSDYLSYEAELLTKRIQEAEQEKRERLKKAESLVAGLEVTDAGLRLHGVPIAQASAARKIMLGLEIIAASNPKLRVALIRDASLLDDNLLAEIERFAEEHSFQILLERVGSDGPTGFGLLIEDGEAVAKVEPEGDPPATGRQDYDDTRRQAESLF